MKVVGKNTYIDAGSGYKKHNAFPLPLNVSSQDITDVASSGATVNVKERRVYDDGTESVDSNIEAVTLTYKDGLSPSMVTETTVYWPQVYDASHPMFSNVTGITKNKVVFYSTDHDLADGGCYVGQFDNFDGDTLNGFQELGVLPIANQHQAETPWLMYVPQAENAYGNEVLHFYYHTAQTDTRNVDADQETHCYTFKGGSLFDVNNWTYRDRPAPVVSGDTHTGYWRSWRLAAGSYVAICFTGQNDEYQYLTSSDAGTWTRQGILDKNLATPSGFVFRQDTTSFFEYNGKKYSITTIGNGVDTSQMALLTVGADGLPDDRIAVLREYTFPDLTGSNFPYQNFNFIEGDTAFILVKKGTNTNNTYPYELMRFDLSALKQTPSITIYDPLSSQQFLAGGEITIYVETQGLVEKVEYYIDGVLTATKTENYTEHTFTNVTAGTKTFEVRLYANGEAYVSDTIDLTVNAATGTHTYLMDAHPTTALANYPLRLIEKEPRYVRIKRYSDGKETDILTDVDPSVKVSVNSQTSAGVTVSSFVSGTKAVVKKVYDNSGNGRHYIPNGDLPVIAENGTLLTDQNGNLVIHGIAGQAMASKFTFPVSGDIDISVFTTERIITQDINKGSIGIHPGTYSSDRRVFYLSNDGASKRSARYSGGNAIWNVVNPAGATDTIFKELFKSGGSVPNYYEDNTQRTLSGSGSNALNIQADSAFMIFGGNGAGGVVSQYNNEGQVEAYYSGAVWYFANKEADRAAIRAFL